ncbi:MAG: hypothetical protein WCJ01_00475 [Ignavibacteria bacterium]
MSISSEHKFHIPILGLGFSIDTPVKVAKYGISSVLSIGNDDLLERMRAYYLSKSDSPYIPIAEKEEDSRAKRVTAYLNMVFQIVKHQFEVLKNSEFNAGSEISKYLEMLPEFSVLKIKYREMLASKDQNVIQKLQQWLRENIKPGSIDVNIMTKLDKVNYKSNGEALSVEYNDAHAALRGFARSDLSGSIVLSAGMNPRLFSYMENLTEFHPDSEGNFNKKLIIKVSDFRSAIIQGKFLAKKGLWVSEYRIESGLNCGGHAFATDGYLLGPILEEFKNRKSELSASIGEVYIQAMRKKSRIIEADKLQIDITVQGGVGKSTEQEFLIRYFGVQSVGWGSPFLLVPEVMNVDEVTLQKLSEAGENDIYLSGTSPLGVPFYNLRNSTKELEKKDRIDRGKFGSPCTQNFLKFNTEFTERPICTASIEFQKKKMKQLLERNLPPEEYEKESEKILEKECLCEGLTCVALIVNDILNSKKSSAVTVCPGPNLAYFSKISTLKEMVDHIYGRINLITDPNRPNMFIKELNIYIDYFHKLIEDNIKPFSDHTEKFIKTFRENLINGINYYKKLIPHIIEEPEKTRETMISQLSTMEQKILQ